MDRRGYTDKSMMGLSNDNGIRFSGDRNSTQPQVNRIEICANTHAAQTIADESGVMRTNTGHQERPGRNLDRKFQEDGDIWITDRVGEQTMVRQGMEGLMGNGWKYGRTDDR